MASRKNSWNSPKTVSSFLGKSAAAGRFKFPNAHWKMPIPNCQSPIFHCQFSIVNGKKSILNCSRPRRGQPINNRGWSKAEPAEAKRLTEYVGLEEVAIPAKPKKLSYK